MVLHFSLFFLHNTELKTMLRHITTLEKRRLDGVKQEKSKIEEFSKILRNVTTDEVRPAISINIDSIILFLTWYFSKISGNF